MGPGERARRTRGAAAIEALFRDIVGIPDLFGNHSAVAGELGHRPRKTLGLCATSSQELVVGPLAGKERPGSSAGAAVAVGERCAVTVLAVAVARVTAPRRAVRGLDAKAGVDRPERVDDP